MDKMTKRLFTALHGAAKTTLASDDPCVAALARAAAPSASVDDGDAARDAMARLPDDVRDRLLADAHFALRSDLSPLGIRPLTAPPPKGTPLN